MKKSLTPMLMSLALCGAAAGALAVSAARAQVAPAARVEHVAPEARAQTAPRKPMMVALVTPAGTLMADNATPPPPSSGPASNGPRLRGMRGRGDMTANLKQLCQDGYAHQVGEMAYLEAKLTLTGPEQPLFARWRDVKLAIARRHQADCATRDMDAPRDGHPPQDGDKAPNLLDGMTREETILKQRLADLEAERPALEAFYNALTPAQKNEFVHPGRRPGMMGPGMMGHGMFDGPPGAQGAPRPGPDPAPAAGDGL